MKQYEEASYAKIGDRWMIAFFLLLSSVIPSLSLQTATTTYRSVVCTWTIPLRLRTKYCLVLRVYSHLHIHLGNFQRNLMSEQRSLICSGALLLIWWWVNIRMEKEDGQWNEIYGKIMCYCETERENQKLWQKPAVSTVRAATFKIRQLWRKWVNEWMNELNHFFPSNMMNYFIC